MLPSTAMDPQEELNQLLARQQTLQQELKAKKKELQHAQRRQRASAPTCRNRSAVLNPGSPPLNASAAPAA